MKRLICATLISASLALSPLAATAASAQSFHGGFGHGGYSHGSGYGREGGWRGRGDGGALLGLGVGLFALGAIAAASEHDRYYNRYDYGPPPPPAYYGRGYDRDYGY
jgi:hypothetical protein